MNENNVEKVKMPENRTKKNYPKNFLSCSGVVRELVMKLNVMIINKFK